MYANLLGQWEILNEGIMERLYTIDFVNENVGWIAGRNILLKTEDAGENWISIPIEENLIIGISPGVAEERTIDFVNDSIGWAIGQDQVEDKAVILKTSTGGLKWFVQYKLPSSYGLRSLIAVNEKIAYASYRTLQRDPGFLQTSDGGLNWIDNSPPEKNLDFLTVYFINSQTGIVFCVYHDGEIYRRGILRTFNGAKTWENIIETNFREISDLQFINDSTGYFIAMERDTYKKFLCTTKDTCRSWSIIAENINSYFTLSSDTIIAIMDDSTFFNVVKSNDGGYTWEQKDRIEKLQVGGYHNIYFNQAGIGFITIYSRGNDIYKSIDRGENWTLNKLTHPFQDVYFFNRNKGVAFSGGMSNLCDHRCSAVGDIFNTNDGGKSWKHHFSGGEFTSSLYVNEYVGYTLERRGLWGRGLNRIYKTTDSGVNWINVYNKNPDSTGFEFRGNDLNFINTETGWAVGTSIWSDSTGAGILSTNDGGETWDLVWKYPNNDEYMHYGLNSIHAIRGEAWAVGEFGMILKYTRQGGWQMQNTITDLPLNEVFFYDQQHGWIAGGYFDEDNEYLMLLKTIDGGETWQEITDFNYQINDMFFENNLHGWAVGSDTTDHGIILETVNGGDSWVVQRKGLSAPLNAIHFKDGYGWAVGGNGQILRTEDGINWIDQKSRKTYPNKFSLSQNYPNPFNPKTIINYELPITNYLELSIYNLLGQKVVTLVSEKQKAGYHQVEWNASGFASGIYYYSIKAGEFQDVKKMILLR